METCDEDDDLANAYHQSMEIVEETLSKLKETVCSWPKSPNFDLGPQKNLTIGHLEDMLSYLRTYTDGGQQSNEGSRGTEGDNPPDSAEHPEITGVGKDDELIRLRCQNTIGCAVKGPIDPSELIESLQMPDPRFQHVAEDVGLGRIFRGYQNIDCDEWSQILEPHIQPLPTSATMIQDVNRVDAVAGLDDRLWERQRFLNDDASFLAGQTLQKFLIKQLEAIKFASDWRQRSKKPGIKKFKKEFVQKSFEADPEHHLLRPNGTSDEQEAYKKVFSSFKLKHGKTITARNYLLQLYHQFGSATLLDRIWDVDKLIGCSKNFRVVLAQLTNTEDDVELQNALQHQSSSKRVNKQCLKNLVSHMGDQTFVDHLDRFLCSYPPRSYAEAIQ